MRRSTIWSRESSLILAIWSHSLHTKLMCGSSMSLHANLMRGSSMSLHANLMRGSSMLLQACIKIPSWRFIPINMIVAFDAEVPGPSLCRWRRDGLSELHHLSLNNRRWTMNPEHITAYGNRTQIPKLIMFWFHQVQTWSSWTKGLYRPLHRLWWRFNSGNESWVLEYFQKLTSIAVMK